MWGWLTRGRKQWNLSDYGQNGNNLKTFLYSCRESVDMLCRFAQKCCIFKVNSLSVKLCFFCKVSHTHISNFTFLNSFGWQNQNPSSKYIVSTLKCNSISILLSFYLLFYLSIYPSIYSVSTVRATFAEHLCRTAKRDMAMSTFQKILKNSVKRSFSPHDRMRSSNTVCLEGQKKTLGTRFLMLWY